MLDYNFSMVFCKIKIDDYLQLAFRQIYKVAINNGGVVTEQSGEMRETGCKITVYSILSTS